LANAGPSVVSRPRANSPTFRPGIQNRRYAELHARTTGRLAGFFERLLGRAGVQPPFGPRVIAGLVLALGSGLALERSVDPDALPGPVFAEFVAAAIGFPIAPDGLPARVGRLG